LIILFSHIPSNLVPSGHHEKGNIDDYDRDNRATRPRDRQV
jgi:hypothetical protein